MSIIAAPTAPTCTYTGPLSTVTKFTALSVFLDEKEKMSSYHLPSKVDVCVSLINDDFIYDLRLILFMITNKFFIKI